MQVDEILAEKLRHSAGSICSLTNERAGNMAGSQVGSRRTDSGGDTGRSRVVLLQRRNSEGHVRTNDASRNETGGDASSSSGSRQGKAGRLAAITNLTPGERLLIHRRRSGESQEATSRRLGMTRNAYGRLERDSEESRITTPQIGELSADEICLIHRRRSGKTQEECAEELGVTRFWFSLMETGKVSCEDLVAFWGVKE